MALNGPAGFADDGRAVIERTVDLDDPLAVTLPAGRTERELLDAYDIERTVARILVDNYQRIALQFPDAMLPDAAWTASQLEQRTEREIFILADTSYGSCCVDEIAAQHVNADFIVHYGPSCLSATQRLPVMYVFGRATIDVEAAVHAFEEQYKDTDDATIVVICDVIYQYAMDDLKTAITRHRSLSSIVIAEALCEPAHHPQDSAVSVSQCCSATEQACCSGSDACSRATNEAAKEPTIAKEPIDTPLDRDLLHLPGRRIPLGEDGSLDGCRIFYVGGEGRTLTNLLMTHRNATITSFNPATGTARLESMQVNRALMKRYYLVQKAKDADVVGIVVGTLGVASYMQMIEHVKQTVRQAGKKFYTFSVGKLNIAKLANFPEIDVFVLIACPENSLIDSKEFYRPVITPFELDLALAKGREWTGDIAVQFHKVLDAAAGEDVDGLSEHADRDNEADDDDDGDVAPRYSLVSGQLKSDHTMAVVADPAEALSEQTSSLTLRNQAHQMVAWQNSPAAEHLARRDFRGLEQRLGEDAPSEVEEGRSGVARGYTTEPGHERVLPSEAQQ